MSNEKIHNLINAIANGHAMESETIFNELAAERVQARLADYRQEVAQTLFTSPSNSFEE